MFVAELILWLGGTYALLGFLVGIPFVRRGVTKIDPATHGTSALFRMLILPGCVALWPWVILHWHRTRSLKGVEHS